MLNSALKATIYDQFQDYVLNTVRDNTNPEITVQDFDKLKDPGPTHIFIALQNAKPSKELYENVEKFRPGTKLVTEEDPKTGGHIILACIPWKQASSKQGRRASGWGSSDSTGKPDTRVLYAYFALMALTAGVALVKTSWADWRFLLG